MKILLVACLASTVAIIAARRDSLPRLIDSEDVDDSPELLSDSGDRLTLSKTLWKGIDLGAERSKNVGSVKEHPTYDSDSDSESESESESDSDSTSEEDSTIEDESDSQPGERNSLKEAIKRRVGELLIEKIKSALPTESSTEEMGQDDDKYYDSFEPEAYEDSEEYDDEYDDTYDEDEAMDYNYVGRLPARMRPVPMKQPEKKVVIVRKTINVNVNNGQSPPAQRELEEEEPIYKMRKTFLDKRPENDVKDMPRPNPFVVRPQKLSVDPPKVPPPMDDFDEDESSEEILTKPDKELKPIEDVGPADTSDDDEDTVVIVKKHHFLPALSQYRLDVIDVILITTTVILASYVIRSVISLLRTPRAAVKPSNVNPSLQHQYPKNPPTTDMEPTNCKNTADVKIHIKEDI